jgi:hypothetical protein
MVRAVNRRDVVGAALLAVLGPCACFLGYDSRWGETKRAQQRVAAQSGPATIAASSPTSQAGVASDAHPRTWRVRLRPNARYLAQTVDAPKQAADLIEDANRVLEPTLALHLESERVQPWARDEEDTLSAALQALRRDDAGEDVDLVVGMIGGLPRQSDSFHELGMATMPGKHLVVRAAARADEHDAIDQAFNELSDDDRARLARLRKRHRALAVFLHEVGHCLGALHERDVGSLMNPGYDTKMSGFGAGTIALMRIGLDVTDRAEVARQRLALLQGSSSGAPATDWPPAERDDEVRRLQGILDSILGSISDAGVAQPDAVAAKPAVPPELSPGDADRFVQARQALARGQKLTAYRLGKPLFEAYPDTYDVQDLRCQIAAIRWLPREELLRECAPFKRLGAAQLVREGGT